MGLFSRKNKAKDYVRMLKKIGVDFYNYTHENLKPAEISVDDEVAGVIKSSFGNFSEEVFFESILLSDKKDGTRNIILIKEDVNEKELRQFTNELYNILGEDEIFYGEFEAKDLQIIRGHDSDRNSDDDIRTWETFYKFAVSRSLSFL